MSIQEFLKIKEIQANISGGNFRNIDYFLENSSNRQAFNYVLEWAAHYGNLNVVKKCINSGAEINSNNGIALQMACLNGHFEVAKYLIIRGADVNILNSAPLINACENNHIEIVKILLKARTIGDNPKLLCDVNGSYDNALRIAVQKNNDEIVNHLIERGANIHIFDDYPLLTAVQCNYLKIVKLLIEKGANKNNLSQLIQIAKDNDYNDMVNYLEQININE